jgi:hypothetical protein
MEQKSHETIKATQVVATSDPRNDQMEQKSQKEQKAKQVVSEVAIEFFKEKGATEVAAVIFLEQWVKDNQWELKQFSPYKKDSDVVDDNQAYAIKIPGFMMSDDYLDSAIKGFMRDVKRHDVYRKPENKNELRQRKISALIEQVGVDRIAATHFVKKGSF